MNIDTQIAASTITLLAEFAKVGAAKLNTCRDMQRRVWASTGETTAFASNEAFDAWKETNPDAARAASLLMLSSMKYPAATRRELRSKAHALMIKVVL